MSLNKKLSLFFVSLYLLSIALFTLVSLVAIRYVLISYAYGYMERYANPIVEFYLEAYKDIDIKNKLFSRGFSQRGYRCFSGR